MSKRHHRIERQLLGIKGSRFISRVFLAITGYPLPAKATVIGIPEYQFEAREIPLGHKTRSMWLDVLFVILTTNERFTIGCEIKADEGDLVFDTKLRHELIADYFFLAVPSKLIPAALYVIRHQQTEDICKIGLVNLDNAEIVILPDTTTPKQHLLEVLIEAFQQNALRLDLSSGSSPRPVTFLHKNGIRICREYLGMLARPYRPELPPLDKCFDRYQLSPLYRQLLREREVRPKS